MSEYTQKYAFVTGSSRGIGRAIAHRLAAEGYHIFLNCSRSFDALEETRQEIEKIGTCTLVPGDIGNPDTVRKIFHTIAKTCDHLDVLVNNAGISHIGLLMDMTDEDWNKVLSSNLLRLLLLPRCHSSYAVTRKRKDHQHFLHVGRKRCILRSGLLCFQSRCRRAHSRHLPKNWQEVKFQSMLLHVVSSIPK